MAAVLLLGLLVALDEQPFGRVVVAMGPVTAQREGNGRSLKVGDRVFRGERIVTTDDGRAKLLLEDRSVITIGPKSELELVGLRGGTEEQPKTTLKLLFGRLWANVQKAVGSQAKFDVATPNAVAGVRGTSFFVESEGTGSRFSVLNGTVSVGQGNTSLVLQGMQQLDVGPNGFSAVVNIPPGAILELLHALSASGGLGGDGLARLEALAQQLHLPNGQLMVVGPQQSSSGGQTPPVNFDPAQTSQSTLIHGHIQLVQP